ncbi:hypothetical protein H6P81_006208 [Aristolochia fimbriata]|uniref:Uncharacterized protein n=1 Tax=Aristolochia fimbriata TaxID=158543 RepID=A0AAV7EXU2_ARIFI|nr:hypothetical protein H6P81_006208 [Aristolochia fimbriata]
MDLLRTGRLTTVGVWCPRRRLQATTFRTHCSSGDGDPKNDNKGDRSSTDWDKAWSSFRKQAKKKSPSRFSPDKYVTWNPRRSEYPLSEEIDPIKRTERSNLELWTSPQFTLVGAILVVTLLLIYTLLAPPPK